MTRTSVLLAATLLLLISAAAAQTVTGIHLQTVTFAGANQLPAADVQKCADNLKSRTYKGEEWLDEVAERARITCWQNHGYFKVMVKPQAEQLADSDGAHQFAVTLTVNEGSQYRLKNITFTGNKALSSETLRASIPLADGELFNSDKIRQGIENLRNAYAKSGYLNFVSVPDTMIDDQSHLISIKWDIAEGIPTREQGRK